MTDNPLVWVLLAPAGASWLEERAAAFREEELGAGEIYLPKWQVQGCADAYSAVISRNPGSERSLEVTFAETLSRELAGTVYVLYMDPDYYGLNVVEVYEGGQHTVNLPDDPYDFARRLGCPLPGDPAETVTESSICSVVVVEGASASDVARALGLDSLPRSGHMRIEDGAAGAFLVHPALGDLTLTAYRLSRGFPGRHIYKLNTGPTPGSFHCLVVRDGEEAGHFEYPATSGDDGLTSRLDSVKGQRTPEGIVATLGVPPHLLNLG